MRPWERLDRAVVRRRGSLGVGVDASAVRRARGVVHPPAPAPAHARRAGGCALTRTKPPRPSPNHSLGPSSLTVRPPLPRSPPPSSSSSSAHRCRRTLLPPPPGAAPPPPAPLPVRPSADQASPPLGAPPGGRTVAAGRVARSRPGGRDEGLQRIQGQRALGAEAADRPADGGRRGARGYEPRAATRHAAKAVRSVYAMEQRERVQQRAKAKREAGGKQLGPRHGYTPCNSASFAGAGDVEVPLNPNPSNLAAATAAAAKRRRYRRHRRRHAPPPPPPPDLPPTPTLRIHSDFLQVTEA